MVLMNNNSSACRRVEVIQAHIHTGDDRLHTQRIASHSACHGGESGSDSRKYSISHGDLISRFHARSGCVHITLNRVKALNALTFDMIQKMTKVLLRAMDDPLVSFVLIDSQCERAFCAGGDIKALLSPDSAYSALFFQWEFNLNRLIHRFGKPVVCLLNGITMGGGVGISIYASHRVARLSDFSFAMPETSIGFFTDIGAGWFLTKLPTSCGMGMYIALTGARLNAWDAAYNGFVTHAVSDDAAFNQLAQRFIELDMPKGCTREHVRQILDNVLDQYVPRHDMVMQHAKLAGIHELVDRVFEKETVEDMFRDLRHLSSTDSTLYGLDASIVRDWSEKTLKTLSKKCPMSLKITMEVLKRGSSLGEQLESVLERDYRVGVRLTRGHNFPEGVRAVLVDKDNRPKWEPARLDDICDADVQQYFEPLDKEIQFITKSI